MHWAGVDGACASWFGVMIGRLQCFEKTRGISIEFRFAGWGAKPISLPAMAAAAGGGRRFHFHAADWIAKFFQGSYFTLRDVLTAPIMFVRQEHPAAAKKLGNQWNANRAWKT